MWRPQSSQLQGPCQWLVGNEIVTWRRVGGGQPGNKSDEPARVRRIATPKK